MPIQAVIFNKKRFTADKAREWLRKHDYKAIKRVDKTKNFLRYRLKNPKQFRTFTTKPLNKSISLIMGFN